MAAAVPCPPATGHPLASPALATASWRCASRLRTACLLHMTAGGVAFSGGAVALFCEPFSYHCLPPAISGGCSWRRVKRLHIACLLHTAAALLACCATHFTWRAFGRFSGPLPRLQQFQLGPTEPKCTGNATGCPVVGRRKLGNRCSALARRLSIVIQSFHIPQPFMHQIFAAAQVLVDSGVAMDSIVTASVGKPQASQPTHVHISRTLACMHICILFLLLHCRLTACKGDANTPIAGMQHAGDR